MFGPKSGGEDDEYARHDIDGDDPNAPVGPSLCAASPQDTQVPAGERSGPPEECQYEATEVMQEQFLAESLSTPIADDGLPDHSVDGAGDGGTHPFHIDNQICVADERHYVEMFAEELVERGWVRTKVEYEDEVRTPNSTLASILAALETGRRVKHPAHIVCHRADNGVRFLLFVWEGWSTQHRSLSAQGELYRSLRAFVMADERHPLRSLLEPFPDIGHEGLYLLCPNVAIGFEQTADLPPETLNLLREAIAKAWPKPDYGWTPPTALGDGQTAPVIGSFLVRSKYDFKGSRTTRGTWRPEETVERWSVRLVKVEGNGLRPNRYFVVRPIRERCRHYGRQRFGNDDQIDPSLPLHNIIFRFCQHPARRSIGGAAMNLGNEAIYDCDLRDPYGKVDSKWLDAHDRKKFAERPDLRRLPMFGLEGDEVIVEDDGPSFGVGTEELAAEAHRMMEEEDGKAPAEGKDEDA